MTDQVTDRLMRIAVSGASGVVGSRLCEVLREQGRDVRAIVRGQARDDSQIAWDTDKQSFDAQALSACDAVVHLAGENIMGRWTDDKKKRLYDSRIESTRALAQALAGLEGGPRTLILASAVGYYGDTGQTDARVETDPPGSGFLAEVCRDWEAAADPAREGGLRVVHVRIGVVLSPKGGALKEMMLPFKLGLGGQIGNGKQWMSWIGLTDMVRVLIHCIDTPTIEGPVNATAPQPTTNRGLTKALGRVLKRPTVLPVPPFAVKLLYGKECAEAIVLGSIRVQPAKLNDMGFVFQFPDLDEAIRHEINLA